MSPSSDFKLPIKEKFRRVLYSFSKKERAAFLVFSALLLISTLGILQSVNKSLMVKVPLEGGSVAEGIVGTPRFVNPVLASSLADQDVVALVYSGLLRKNGTEAPIPDLAETYTVSENGLVYTFTLRDRIYFHNGDPVTVDDVLFTIDRVKNSLITSPHRARWTGATAKKIDEKTVEFTLREPNPDFLKNATLGIIPKKIWENDSMELNVANTEPVGSGPYRIEDVTKEPGGTITSYTLRSFDKFALGAPYIEEIVFRFYPNEDDMANALRKGEVMQAGSVSPEIAERLAEQGYAVKSSPLPRVFGLFFNQNQNQLFLDKTIVRAIDTAIDKERIVRDVLRGFGTAINGPIPPSVGLPSGTAAAGSTREEALQAARTLLEKAGWKPGAEGFYEKSVTDRNKKTTTTVLGFSVFTSNIPELARIAELIREDLAAAGMKVEIRTFEPGSLNQNVIRPRKFDALLFGQVIESPSDLFAFWHSSQRKDPGLNVASYTNAKVDSLLEEAAVTRDAAARMEKYKQFESEVNKDMPAVFLYSPDFIYVVADSVGGFALDHIANPAERFAAVHTWFTKTEDVWKIFSKK